MKAQLKKIAKAMGCISVLYEAKKAGKVIMNDFMTTMSRLY